LYRTPGTIQMPAPPESTTSYPRACGIADTKSNVFTATMSPFRAWLHLLRRGCCYPRV
jgi:hypothetical protein